MDKLKTDLYGGFPFELDDWRWEVDAHRKAIGSLGWALGELAGNWHAVILHGIVVTPGSVAPPFTMTTVTPGAIVIAGEVYYYNGGIQSPSWSLDQLWLEVEEVASPAGNETFEDGSVQDTYLIRRVALRAGPQPPAPGVEGVRISEVPRIEDARARSGDWQPITIQDSAFVGLLNRMPAYRTEPGGVVRLRGAMQIVELTGSTPHLVFVLPEQARPSAPVTLLPVLISASGGAFRPGVASLTNNGGVELAGLDPIAMTYGDRIYLDSITFATS